MNLIQITVAPHVSQYIRHHFGDRVLLSDQNLITSILKSLLKPFDKVDPGILKSQKKDSLGAFIEVYVSDHFLRKYGGSLNNEAILSFNKSIDQIIKQEMYRWCHHPNSYHKEVDYNIKAFIAFYDFQDEDLSFDNLKRWYYRERERIGKRKVDRLASYVPELTIPLLLCYHEPSRSISQLSLFGH